MTFLLAMVVGVLFGAGVFLLVRRSLFKLVIGLILLGHATNLLIFVSAKLVPGQPPFLEPDVDPALLADPLPQALILTAIVISLGVTAFALVLAYKFYGATAISDLDDLKEGGP